MHDGMERNDNMLLNLLVEDTVIVKLKSIEKVAPVHNLRREPESYVCHIR